MTDDIKPTKTRTRKQTNASTQTTDNPKPAPRKKTASQADNSEVVAKKTRGRQKTQETNTDDTPKPKRRYTKKTKALDNQIPTDNQTDIQPTTTTEPSEQKTQINIEALNQRLQLIAKEVRQAFDNRDYRLGQKIIIEKVFALAPNHPIGFSDLAFAEKAMGNFDKAYEYSMQALQYAKDEHLADICDTLTSICYRLHRYEEALYYARMALDSKKRKVANQSIQALPKPKTLSDDKQRNVISFSLFGSDPKYCETAVINASLAPVIYPQWTCRFYVDSSVPEHVIARLQQYQAQIVMMDDNTQFSGLFWRFLVVCDPSVDCFMIRDCDSLLSHKEQAAVNAWLDSGKYFHIMRDAIEHSELILAGMWGGYAGVFDDIQERIQAFANTLNITSKTIDQQFLRNYIYPTVAQDVLVHDSYHLDFDGLPFPRYQISEIERIPYFHIGMIDANGFMTQVELDTPCTQAHWYLFDDKNRLICHYVSPTTTQNGQTLLILQLPYFYSENIRKGSWRIICQKID